MTLTLEAKIMTNLLPPQLFELVKSVEEKNADTDDSAQTGDHEKQRRKDHKDAVNDRLRDLAIFERRYKNGPV